MLAALLPALARAQTPADGFVASVAVDGLAQPTAAAFLPDGRLVILEKGGTVRLWTQDGGLRPAPIGRFPVCTASEMGLLGIAVDPDFAATRRLFLYLTHPPGWEPARCGEGSEAGRRNRVVRVSMDGDDASVTGGPFWNGDYVFGDFVQGRVWRAPLDAARADFAAPPAVLVRDVGGPVDFVVGPDGALWIVAFQRGRCCVSRATARPCRRAAATPWCGSRRTARAAGRGASVAASDAAAPPARRRPPPRPAVCSGGPHERAPRRPRRPARPAARA